MIERWLQCPQWPDYDVSTLGNVRRTVKRFGGAIGLRTPYLSTTGYWYLVMRRPGFRKACAIHQLVAEAFIGPTPSPDHQIAHGDGNKLNNDPANLRWATRSENESDKVFHGRSNRGERQGRSRLKEREVIEIRARVTAGERRRTVAFEYGVAYSTVGSIMQGQSWRWLDDEIQMQVAA